MIKKILINGDEVSVSILSMSADSVTFEYDGQQYTYHVKKNDKRYLLTDGTGRQHQILSPSRGVYLSKEGDYKVEMISHKASKAGHAKNGLVSPLPGKVINVLKKDGDTIEEGDTVLVVEAMKMEHKICADSKGRIMGLSVKSGDTVVEGQQLGRIV